MATSASRPAGCEMLLRPAVQQLPWPGRSEAHAHRHRARHLRSHARRWQQLARDLPDVKCYSGQPSSSFHGLEGLKHMPTAIVPGIYDPTLADGNIWLETCRM